jgi:hypothetical protein
MRDGGGVGEEVSGGYDLAMPDAAGLVASLSSLGYSLEAAIADLVDNSVSAEAQTIDVVFTWVGRDSWIAVVDDGTGMSLKGLVTAMTVAARGPKTQRSASDLGRFGVGLKSASFSQARQLTMSTAEAGTWHTRTWDLDAVEQSGEWLLLHGADNDSEAVLELLREQTGQRGTIVLWRRLNGYHTDDVESDDEKTQEQFYAEANRTRAHLGMVFERFLGGRNRLRLLVSGEPVEPWDPFLTRHPSVQRMPVEVLPVGNASVRVEAFVLPGAQRLSEDEYRTGAGPRGWLDQQGFYVYRRDRLIVAGDWLGLRGLRQEERYSLARLAVDIPVDVDVEWGVDVRKSSVVPPVALRRDLTRIARHTREQAAAVLRFRGRLAARTHSGRLIFAWSVKRDSGEVTCRINRSHPLVVAALRTGADRKAIHALLRLLEETVPVTALRVAHETDTVDDPEPFGGAGPANDDALEVAQQIYQALIDDGRSPGAARERLRATPPFDQLDGFWS